jgi:hypothetical protein
MANTPLNDQRVRPDLIELHVALASETLFCPILSIGEV